MTSWTTILEQIQKQIKDNPEYNEANALAEYRQEKIKAIAEKTGRNLVTYYSGFLAGKNTDSIISRADRKRFEEIVLDMDPEKGLDVILHTPGGDGETTEYITDHIHNIFGNNLRVIVPQCAYSSGTLFSSAAKTILMGHYSCLGPIDLQVEHLSAYEILSEYDSARKDLRKDPESIPFWDIRFKQEKYGYYHLLAAITFASAMVSKNLTNYMFADEDPKEAKAKVKRIVDTLNDNHKNHRRPFTYNFCKELGLNVEFLGNDPELEDLVLSLHKAYMITFQHTSASKIMENQLGTQYLINQEER